MPWPPETFNYEMMPSAYGTTRVCIVVDVEEQRLLQVAIPAQGAGGT